MSDLCRFWPPISPPEIMARSAETIAAVRALRTEIQSAKVVEIGRTRYKIICLGCGAGMMTIAECAKHEELHST